MARLAQREWQGYHGENDRLATVQKEKSNFSVWVQIASMPYVRIKQNQGKDVMSIMDTDEVTTQEITIPFENVAEVPATGINVSHGLEASPRSKVLKGSRNFTQEERATIVELAREVGAPKAAHELGINVKMIYYWAYQEKQKQKLLSSQSEQAASPASLSASLTEIDTNQTQDTQDIEQEHSESCSGNIAIQNESVVEDIDAVQSVKPTESGNAAPQTQKTMPSNVLNQQDEKQSLIIENAVLKEKVATLTAELARVKAAMLNLMQLNVN